MGLDDLLQAVQVPPLEALLNEEVVLVGFLHGLEVGEGEEVAVFPVDRDLLHELGQGGVKILVPAGLPQPVMDLQVLLEIPLMVPGLVIFAELGGHQPELLELVLREVPDDLLHRVAVQGPDDLVELSDLGVRGPLDEDLPAGRGHEELLGREAEEGLADGRGADLEEGGDLLFLDPLARLEIAADDGLLQMIVDSLTDRGGKFDRFRFGHLSRTAV